MDTTIRNALVVSLYNEGLYPIAIRAKIGVSLSQIYRILRAANVTIRSQAESHRRHQMDFTFFERIDSHVKAQVLGFIAADGCVTHNTISIKIAYEDHAYLEWIKSAVGYTGEVRVYESRRPNEQAMSHLTFCSPKMVADITRLGCGPRKSLTLEWPTPEQVPSEFLSSYMLGYFEGDGSISLLPRKNRPNPESVVTIAGTRSFCEHYAQAAGVPARVIDLPNNAIQLLRIDGNRHVKHVMDYLYSRAAYTMPRKREKYDLLCQQLKAVDERRDEIIAQARSVKRIGTGMIFYLKSLVDQRIHRIDGLRRFCHVEGIAPLSVKGVLAGTFVHARWTLPTQTEIDIATENGTLDQTHSR